MVAGMIAWWLVGGWLVGFFYSWTG